MNNLLQLCASGALGLTYHELAKKQQTYERLAEEYSNLKTPAEIAEFIKKHKDDFNTEEEFQDFLKEVKKNGNKN